MNRTIRLVTLVSVAVCVAGIATLWPAEALAQPRGGGHAVPRPVQPAVAHPGGYHGYYPSYRYAYPYYRYPVYYAPFSYGFGFGFGVGFGFYGAYGCCGYYGYPGYASYGYPYWGPGPYPAYAPYGYYGVAYDAGSDLRLQVTPREADVYIDGYLVGRVDNYDGVLQRLRVPNGEHEIVIYQDGYQPIHQKMLFRPGESYRIREAMRQLAAGETAEPRPTPSAPPDRNAIHSGPPQQPSGPPSEYPPPRGNPPAADSSAFGAVSIRVQPVDAEVLVDGERWERPAGESRLLVEVSEGTHRIEIRKDGYRPYVTTIRVRRGETLPLNVSLPLGGQAAAH